MEIKIRKGVKTDLPSVLKLIKELADYENAKDQVTITLDNLEHDGFGQNPWYWFLVAEKEDEIVGLSFYWIRYSTWKGKFLFLEDFVIKEKFRRRGIGSQLFEETIKIPATLNNIEFSDMLPGNYQLAIATTDTTGTTGRRSEALMLIIN